MKILFVSAYFPPDVGGVESYVYNVALTLKNTYNYEVVVVTSNTEGTEQVCEEYMGLKMYRLPIWKRIANTPINPMWYFALKKIIRVEKPDIINSQQPVPFLGDLAAIVAGDIPFVLSYHSGTMKKNKFLFDIVITLYEKFVLAHTARRATHIVCVSHFVRNNLLKMYAAKTTVINAAVNISLFKPDTKVRREEQLVLFVARHKKMYAMKGLPYLIDAVSMIPGVRLRVVGEPDVSSNEYVEYVGLKREEELVEEMRKASVLVLPSVAPMESFGLVLLEALACQTPVIGTYMGGIPEVIDNGSDGYIVPPRDSEALKQAIVNMLYDQEQAKRMGQTGATKVREQYTWEICSKLNNEVFTSCLN